MNFPKSLILNPYKLKAIAHNFYELSIFVVIIVEKTTISNDQEVEHEISSNNQQDVAKNIIETSQVTVIYFSYVFLLYHKK